MALHLLPRELAAQSASSSEIALPFNSAIRAIDALAPASHILGWEGWLRLPNGSITHSAAHQGTTDLAGISAEAAAELCRNTIIAAQGTFDSAPEIIGSTLLFCITVA